MKPILIHTHIHNRRTGVTRSIENVLPYFDKDFETYIYGNTVDGKKISFLKLCKLLFSNRKTVVHCHRNNEILRILFFRFLGAKFKLVATRHSETLASKITLYLLKKADKLVTLTPAVSKKIGIQNSIVNHGINSNIFKPNSFQKVKNISQENIMLCAGRVRKAKGQFVLIEAAKILVKHKNWALAIVGKIDKPTFLSELKTIVKKHGIENQVYFIKETDDIIKYYQASKIVVAPSFSEGFSLVTAEAMSCGCTVIATKNVGIHNALISNNNNGYLFEPGNSDTLQNLLENLILEKIPFLGNQARTSIIANWSAKKEASELIKIYNT